MIKVLTLLMLAFVASAHQSTIFDGTATGTATLPASAPWQGLSTIRIEFRIHNITNPASQTYLWALASDNIWAAMLTNGDVRIFDGSNGGTFCDIPKGAQTDMVYRWQRAVGQLTRCEAWASATITRLANLTTDAPIAATGINGSLQIGSSAARARLAFFRVFTTSLAANSAAPSSNDGIANAAILDYRFEGNANASAGGINLTMAGATYATTPAVLPIALFSQTGSAPSWVNGTGYGLARAGQVASFDGSGSTGDTAITYSWNVIAPPYPTTLTSYTAATTSFIPPTFGQYLLRLTVTDTIGQTASASVKVGATASNSSNVIAPLINTDLLTLLGNLTRSGSSTWTQYEQDEFLYAAEIGPELETVPWPFSTALAGTIAFANNSATVTGTGTSFLSTFNCNGTDYINVFYPRTSPATGIGRRTMLISSCASNTQLTLSANWLDSAGSTSGAQYGRVTSAELAPWINGSANWNYYDVVLALYRTWARTGVEDFRTTARALAAKWLVYPLDQGYACNLTRFACPAPRLQGLYGMMAYALDTGNTAMWADIYRLTDDQFSFYDGQLNNTRTDYDVRDRGYQSWFYALHAKYDPDAGRRADALTKAQTWGDQWWIYKQANTTGTGRSAPDGSWPMELDPSQQYNGSGNLPWQHAFPIRALFALNDVDPQTKWRTAAYSGLDFNDRLGWCGGSAYSLYYTLCEGAACGTCVYGGSIGTISCTGAAVPCTVGQDGSRQTMSEYQSLFARKCKLTGDAGDCAKASQYFARAFGRNGGIDTDGSYGEYGVDIPSLNLGPAWDQRGKRYGFASGAGEAAKALGDMAPTYQAENRTVNIYVDPAAVGAVSVRMTLTRPGLVAVSCIRDAPGICSLVGDAAQGDHLLTREYWSGAGATGTKLASSSIFEDMRLR